MVQGHPRKPGTQHPVSMADMKILLVEDEAALAEIVREVLEQRGFNVQTAHSLADALKGVQAQAFDLFIFDVMLPDGDGYNLLKQIRRRGIQTPALFLTSRSLPADVVQGFESGANDYLKKPFGMEELLVRIRALLGLLHQPKTESAAQASVITIGEYHFYYPQGLLLRQGQQRQLTFREAEILFFMLSKKDELISRKEMLLKFWSNDDYFSGRSLDVFITKLRRYLAKDPAIAILNFRGKGYKLIS